MSGSQSLKGKRVRKTGQSLCGTVLIDSGKETVGVVWDDMWKHVISCDRDILIVVESEPVGVPPEARPVSVGVLKDGNR